MSLQELFAMISQVLPGLDGSIAGRHGQSHHMTIDVDHAPALAVQHLYQFLQSNYPEAGPHYWSCCCWNLLIWQPVYLCVLSTHVAHCVPSLNGMKQTLRPGLVAGFSLPQQALPTAKTESLIKTAATNIVVLRESLYLALCKHTRLPEKLANMLEADCVTSALLHAQQHRKTIANSDIKYWSQQWLDALQLSCTDAVIEVKMEKQAPRLAICRQSCCQHFRRADGEKCHDCPKRSMQERHQILRMAYCAASD